MSRVVIVPGLAVRTYALDTAAVVRRRGYDVDLLRAPAWRGTPARLDRYGRTLGRQLDEQEPVSLLVGLSVGTQAAAVAAAASSNVEHLLLVSPTVDPVNRTFVRLMRAWLSGEGGEDGPNPRHNLRDWSKAGAPRMLTGIESAVRVPIEAFLPAFGGKLTIVHTEHDNLGGRGFAERLAYDNGGRFIQKPGAPHSWPVNDPAAFADLVDELLA